MTEVSHELKNNIVEMGKLGVEIVIFKAEPVPRFLGAKKEEKLFGGFITKMEGLMSEYKNLRGKQLSSVVG